MLRFVDVVVVRCAFLAVHCYALFIVIVLVYVVVRCWCSVWLFSCLLLFDGCVIRCGLPFVVSCLLCVVCSLFVDVVCFACCFVRVLSCCRCVLFVISVCCVLSCVVCC